MKRLFWKKSRCDHDFHIDHLIKEENMIKIVILSIRFIDGMGEKNEIFGW
jgi:hypothetical protein